MKRFGMMLLTACMMLSMSACCCTSLLGGTTDVEEAVVTMTTVPPPVETVATTVVTTTSTTIVPKETETTVTTTTTTAAPGNRYEYMYAGLIEDYRLFLDYRVGSGWDGTVAFEGNGTIRNAVSEDLDYEWTTRVGFFPDTQADDFGYILHDIDDDDVPEFFWVQNNHEILAVFTYHNGEVVLLDAYWYRHYAYVAEEGELYSGGSSGAGENQYNIYSVQNGQLTAVCGFRSTYNFTKEQAEYYEFDQGEEVQITQERYEQLCAIYPCVDSEFWLSQEIHPLT